MININKIQIEELKKNVLPDYSLELDKEKLTLSKIYSIANRTPYQTALLFQYAYRFLLSFGDDETRRNIKLENTINMAEFESCIRCYTHYSCMNTMFESKLNHIITQNFIFIEELIDVVFGKILVGKADDEPDYFAKIRSLKDEKPKTDSQPQVH